MSAEKLTVLTNYLSDACWSVIQSRCGEKEAYKYAFRRLKETYGRRNVMRAVQLQAHDKQDTPRETQHD